MCNSRLSGHATPNSSPSSPSYPSSSSASSLSPSSSSCQNLSSFRCLICLDDKPLSERCDALSCPHHVCATCLGAQWTHAIRHNSVAFPKCAVPDCHAYGSDAAVSSVVSPVTASRMRQLRGLKPARAADGRRMYCVAEGCYEQLPPPPLPSQHELEDENFTPNHVTTCPACGVAACMRCGTRSHPGKECTTPLVCRRQKRLYHSYAVGRVTACPRCGVHIERAGGCRSVTCSRCRWVFTFTPFRNVDEVAEASDVRDVPPPEVVPVSWANAFGVLLSSSFSMILGSVVSGVFCSYLLKALAKWSFDWFLLLIVPQFVMGLVFFVIGFFGCLAICRDLFPQVGVHTPNSISNVFGIAILSAVMLIAQYYVGCALSTSGIFVETWQWYLCFLPVILCHSALLIMALAHLLIIAIRGINDFRRRQGYAATEETALGDLTEQETNNALEQSVP